MVVFESKIRQLIGLLVSRSMDLSKVNLYSSLIQFDDLLLQVLK